MPGLLDDLKGGDRRSIGASDEVAARVQREPLLFGQLWRGLFVDNPVIRVRAADAIEKVTRSNPDLLIGHEAELLHDLARLPDKGVRWHVAQMLPRLHLGSQYRQEAIDLLKTYLADESLIVRASAPEELSAFAEAAVNAGTGAQATCRTQSRRQDVTDRVLRLGHLYPSLMNIYGDRGNIICLQRRCRLRGIELEVKDLEVGDELAPDGFDLLFMGGAQDREQALVAHDLVTVKGGALREAVEDGVAYLGVCGGYQLGGRFYRGAGGEELPGAGIFDLYTLHPGAGAKRLIGNLSAQWEQGTLTGFENHGGRTYLGPGCRPWARVLHGYGNDGESGYEGARYKNAFGCYLHGPVLPKNPSLADHLISLALQRRYGDGTLVPLHDEIESKAHAAALKLR